jgi:hypothetical protein
LIDTAPTSIDTQPTSDDPVAPVDAPDGSWLSRQRYWMLAGLVVLAVASQTRNQQWTTDMWMHAAAVRELASHPFHPGDPVISAVHDSAWLSPYTWMVGRLATLFDGNALTALSIAAVVNVALVLVAFRSFVIELTGNRRAPFYALLAALLLWGPRAWRWSGVIHLDSIGYVAPYPSMFALAAFLFVLTLASRLARTGVQAADWWRLVALGVGVMLVALCHPPTGVVLAVVGPVVVLCRCRPLAWRPLLWLAAPVVVGLGIAALWPFFPLFKLSPSGFYATSDELFYQSVPQRIAPAMLGLIVVYRRTRADWRDPMAWLVAAALVLYGVGYWSGIGRPIIFAVLVLQIAVGDGLGRIEAAWSAHRVARWQQGYAVAFGVLAVLGLVFLRAGPVRMIPEEIRPSGLANDEELAKVSDTYEGVGATVDDDVVLVSDTPSIYLPAFGGKLVSSDFWENPLAADDVATRRRATKDFFRDSTTSDRRREILREYDVRYVVLSDTDKTTERLDDLEQLGGQTVSRGAGLVVVRVPTTD